MAAVQVEGLTKRYGRTVAVDSLSFKLDDGAVTGFLGRNGAGKSTTLRMLLGLARPTSGEALIDGKPYKQLRDPARHVGAIIETPTFHPGRRARDHLKVLAASAGIPVYRVDEALAEAGLTEAADKRVGAFSLGMRQRLGLAAALLGDPKVLLLDEPMNGLDPPGVQWLRRFLRARADRGCTVLISSHLLAEVELSVDQVIIIDSGRMVTQASLDELVGGDSQRVKVRSPNARTLQMALSSRGIVAELQGSDLVIARATPHAVGRVVVDAGIVIHEMNQDRSHLEDRFLRLVEEARK
jgi:ABC-2 type transport system ATP-binding protein